MARDLDHEDKVRELRMQEEAARSLVNSPGYSFLLAAVEAELLRARTSLEGGHRLPEAELRVLQGEVKAYQNVTKILERKLTQIRGELQTMGG